MTDSTKERWKTIFTDFDSSGLSAVEYCRQKGINLQVSSIHAGSRRTPQPGPNLPVVTHYPRFLIRQGLKSGSFRFS